MSVGEDGDALKTDELTAIIRQIQDKVRSQYPSNESGECSLPLMDLLPLLHARDAAEAKVASIGTVNPRPPGFLNGLVQRAKRLVARLLNWHVRDQVDFNRALMAYLEAVTESLNQANCALAEVAATLGDADELKDMRSHLSQWRAEWERRLDTNEVTYLRSVAETQADFQHKLSHAESSFRDLAKRQHSDFSGELEQALRQYEQLIHRELRLVRQRAALPSTDQKPVKVSVPPAPQPPFDYTWFAERFRGPEDRVKQNHAFYVPFFQGSRAVLDVGCGRGEFLELMKQEKIPARGIDLSAESVSLCRDKGLAADVADLFTHLGELDDSSVDGIFCAQVVEHLPPERLPEFVRLASKKLASGGLLVLESPNPECLAVFASHFYADPTHVRPVPASLLSFYMEEFGLGRIEIHRLSPAVDSWPVLRELPDKFRETFFGGLDYAIIGRKLS